MADEKLVVDFPADSYGDDRKTRHIETRPQISHYMDCRKTPRASCWRSAPRYCAT